MNFSSSSFPPLLSAPSTSSVLGSIPLYRANPLLHPMESSSCNWKALLNSHNESSKSLSLPYVPSSEAGVCFSEVHLAVGHKDWELSLVGHVIGKRPYYASLLAAVKKKWTFKGQLDLLTLEGDFFLFKFSCKEDFNMVWDHGLCFLNDRPFIFKVWLWNFFPVKENFSEIPLWIKLPNFPLCCWNEEGFSQVACKIGVPLAADNLTAARTCITFAKICVQGDMHVKRREKLKEEVKRLIKKKGFVDQLELFDSLQKLGVAYHFEVEIKTLLNLMKSSEEKLRMDFSEDVYVALYFRLSREHGVEVSKDGGLR